jgi:hypothetical protein
MTTASLIFGAACMGWLLPEFLFILAPAGTRNPPLGINLLSVIGMAAVAYGLKG